MDSHPSVLGLEFDWNPELGAMEVVFRVDGVRLFDGCFGAGMPIGDLLCDPSPLLSDLPHRVVLRRCSCASIACGSASAVISADQSHVHWTDWEVLSLEGAVEPECMYFERSQYEAVVTEAMRRVPVELREPHEAAQSWERVVRPGGPGEGQVQ